LPQPSKEMSSGIADGVANIQNFGPASRNARQLAEFAVAIIDLTLVHERCHPRGPSRLHQCARKQVAQILIAPDLAPYMAAQRKFQKLHALDTPSAPLTGEA